MMEKFSREFIRNFKKEFGGEMKANMQLME
jgi:hypothetical protein